MDMGVESVVKEIMSLPAKAKKKLIGELLRDEEFLEEVCAILLWRERKDESRVSLKEFLAGKRS